MAANDSNRERIDTAEEIPPRADAMMESLRAVGYTLGSAVADLVDNSITARARNIDVHFLWKGADSAVLVVDDGEGMSEDTLREAMRPGTRSPREARERHDLGRFGLGLKTASFSQARVLSVVSKTTGDDQFARHWDLSILETERRWLLCKGVMPSAAQYLGDFGDRDHGTMVIWQDLDRLIAHGSASEEHLRDIFLEQGMHVRKYLGMVFHRFLAPPNPLKLTVNGNLVVPWDPFLRDHEKTQWLEKEAHEIFGEQISVRPFVLPHHSHLTPEQHENAAGLHGWNAMQGFYVYRQKRLLIAGDYLGLSFHQEPHYSLARIQIDIPNTLDSEWQIDVKKSSASPPSGLRSKLKKVARVTRKRASDVYRHRGKVVRRKHAGEDEFVWELRTRHGKKRFAVNRNHPVISGALSGDAETARTVKDVLNIVERTIPLETMALQYQEAPEEFSAAGDQADDRMIADKGMELFRLFTEAGMTSGSAREKLMLIEPFGDSAALQAKLEELEER